MGTVASQITSRTIVYTAVYSDADQSKHQSSASLAFVWGIHRGPVNSPHKWPVTRKMFPFDDVIINDRLQTAILSDNCDSNHPHVPNSMILGQSALRKSSVSQKRIIVFNRNSSKIFCSRAIAPIGSKPIIFCRNEATMVFRSNSNMVAWYASPTVFIEHVTICATCIDDCLSIYPAVNCVRIWSFVCSDSSNYLNRCRLVVNWTLRNKLWNRNTTKLVHDDVIKWKHFPRGWPFVRGIHPTMLTCCGLLTPYDEIHVDQHWLSNGDGVLPDDTKRLHKSTHKKCFVVPQSHTPPKMLEDYTFKITNISPLGQCVN